MTAPRNSRFQLEILEPRVLLSADPSLLMAAEAVASSDPFAEEDSVPVAENQPATSCEAIEYSAQAQLEDIFGSPPPDAVPGSPESDSPETNLAAAADPTAKSCEVVAAAPATSPTAQPSAADSPGLASQVDASSTCPQLVTTLHAANGPPDVGYLAFSSPSGGAGMAQVTNVANLMLEEEDETLIRIFGWNANNNPVVYDQTVASGDVTLDGTLKISFPTNFVPLAGQTFNVVKWSGTRTGEFANYRGTTVPGNNQLAFKIDYDDINQVVRLTVVDTESVAPEIERAIRGLAAMVGNVLNLNAPSLGSLPLIGSRINDLLAAKQQFEMNVRDALLGIVQGLPTQADVTSGIEGLDGGMFANLLLSVDSVRGIYSQPSDPTTFYGWDVKLTLEETKLTALLEQGINAVFGFLFGPGSNVTIRNTLELDFRLGFDGGTLKPFVDFHDVTFRTKVIASDLNPLALLPPWFPPNAPVSVDVTATIIFEASLTITPNANTLPGGHWLAVDDMMGNPILPNLSDFTTTKGSSLDATLVLTANVNAIWQPLEALFDYDGVHTLHIVDEDLFDSVAADMTLTIDGTAPNDGLKILGQRIQGIYTFYKAGTSDDIAVVANITNLDLKVTTGLGGPEFRILKATGSGHFLLKDDGKMAGTVSLTIAPGMGPELPNLDDFSGTFTLVFNTSPTAIDVPLAVPVDMDTPTLTVSGGGPYYRVEGQNVILDLGIPDLILHATTFTFEPTDPTPADPNDQKQDVLVTFTGLSFDFKAPSGRKLLSLTNGAGLFLMTQIGMEEGMVGVIETADVAIDVFGVVGLTGNFSGAINDFTVAVNRSFTVNGAMKTINVPAGKYLRVSATGPAVLGINAGGLTGDPIQLSGNFTFEQRIDSDMNKVMTVGFTNVVLPFFGQGMNPILTVSNISGILISNDKGLAGQVSVGTFQFGNGQFGLTTNPGSVVDAQFKTFAEAIDFSVQVGPQTIMASLEAGEFVRFRALDMNLVVAGFNFIRGNFGFEQRESNSGRQVLTIVGDDLDFNFGAASPIIDVRDGHVLFVMDGGQIAGAGDVVVDIIQPPGVAIDDGDPAPGVHLNFNFNNDAVNAVNEVFDWEGTPAPVNVPAGKHLELGGPLTISLLGGAAVLKGDLRLSQVDGNGQRFVGIKAEDLQLELKAGTTTVIAFHHGDAQFAIFNDGLAGLGALDFQTGLIGVSGDIHFELNTTNHAIHATEGGFTINLTQTNYLRVTVLGHIQVGPGAFPFNFTIAADLALNEVVFAEVGAGPGQFLVKVTNQGNIILGNLPALPSFDQVGEHTLFSMLKQFLLYLDLFRDSAVLNAQIPFSKGTTIGDVLDFTKVFVDQIYSKVATVELRSVANFSDPLHLPLNGVLNNVQFNLQVGPTGSPVLITLNGAFNSAAQLVARLNTALNGNPNTVGRVLARINKEGQVVMALTESETAKHSILQLTFVGNAIPHPMTLLGFVDNQNAIETSRYDLPEFVTKLGQALGLNPAPVYDPNSKMIVYKNVALDAVGQTFSVPFDLGGDLGPIGGASLKGTIQAVANLGMNFSLGFDLSALEVPRLLSSPLIPVPTNGRLKGDAHFVLMINQTESYTFTLTTAMTSNNNSVQDLASDLNTLFAGQGLKDRIIAQKAGQGIAISALHEDLDGDHKLDLINEDADNNGRLDMEPAGQDTDSDGLVGEHEDSDGDGHIDVNENVLGNNDGNLDSQLNIINELIVTSAQTDPFATEMGFGMDPIDILGVKSYLTGARSQVKGLFIEDASFNGAINISTPGGISGSLRLGFVEITLDKLNSNFQTSPPITVFVSLANQQNGMTRFYIPDLMKGIPNILNMVAPPLVTGGFTANLAVNVGIATADLPGITLPASAKISVVVPDLKNLTYNPQPYAPGKTGLFITLTDLNGLANFQQISFNDVLGALRAIVDILKQLEGFSFLNEEIPLIDASLADLLKWATKVGDLVQSVAASKATAIQGLLDVLEKQIVLLFNLNPNDPTKFDLTFDDTPDPKPTLVGMQVRADFNPFGLNNGVRFTSTNVTLTNAIIRIVGSKAAVGGLAIASWDATARILTVQIDPGVTTANAILAAVNGLAGSPWGAQLLEAAGTGLVTKTAIKLHLGFIAGYGNSLPLQLDLRDLVGRIAGDNSAAIAFLQQATTFIRVTGSGKLSVAAQAELNLDFGLDITNPDSVKPFLYDSTGVSVKAEVLGKQLNFEASLGSVAGLFVRNGEVTFDADGDPNTDGKAFINLGLIDNNGDNRHYFSEPIFDGANLGFTARAGLTASLPVYFPTEGSPVGGSGDQNNDGFPDNNLVIDIPDLFRLFSPDQATGNTATIRMRGDNNDFTITTANPAYQGFTVVFVHNPSIGMGAPLVNYLAGSNTLSVTINSGVTTATQTINAIQAHPDFNSQAVPGDNDNDPDTTRGNNKVAKTTLAAPDFNSLFDNLDFCAIIDQHAGLLLDGLDSLLGIIQDGLTSAVGALDLPLIGDGLSGAVGFIAGFRAGLLNDLRMAVEASGGSGTTAIENAIKEAFWKYLGPAGLNLLVDPATGAPLDASKGAGQLDVKLNCDNGLVVNLRLASALNLVNTPIDFDLGVPGFGLEVDGKVVVQLRFDLKLRFGLNAEDGFYFDTSGGVDNPELFVGFEASIPGFQGAGQLFFLTLEVTDQGSFFHGGFEVDIRDPNSDGKLTFAEMTSSGVSFDDVVHARLAAVANIDLHLAGGFSRGAQFPRVVADFRLNWEFTTDDGASDPVIRFENVGLDLGSYVSEFLLPILSKIHEITEPFEPIVEIVTAPLPIISDLAGRTINLLDLFEAQGLLSPTSRKFIEVVITIIKLAKLAENITPAGNLFIPFGAFDLSAGESGDFDLLQVAEDAANSFDPEGFLHDTESSPSAEASASAGFAGNVGSLDNFHIPIFDNPLELANIFLGKPVSLIEWDMPQFQAEAQFVINIPIFGPLAAQFGGRIGMTIDIGFGYDTFGIQKFIESNDVIDIFDGFYVKDFDAAGKDRDELVLSGELFAGVVIDLLVATAGVRGGVGATIGFDLNDPNQDARVRVSEIISNAKIDPRCIFNIHGEFFLFLEAFLTVDLFLFSIDETWEFGHFTLFEFSLTCPVPTLADVEANGVLNLNVGTRAGHREEIDTSDSAETFIVTHVSGDFASGETLEVRWNGYSKQFVGIKTVKVEDAGAGNDVIELRGVLAAVNINGGIGNDTILLSERGDSSQSIGGGTINGGAGNDTITINGFGPGLTIVGGDGNDIITAGGATIIINGGGGSDMIFGSPQDDTLNGDDGADNIQGFGGIDTINGGSGNDTIDAGVGDDVVFAGAGADSVIAGQGNDYVDAGANDDVVNGGPGNDVLVGGTGSDQLNGYGGVDLLIGDTYNDSNRTLLRQLVNQIAAGTAPASIPVNGIGSADGGLFGNDALIGGGNYDLIFGGDGDDFLFGGNFMNSGETEVIEEDFNDFIDGGKGADELYGDDAHGRTGDRDTGIAIRSSVWLDQNDNGVRDPGEPGVGGVTVQLFQKSVSPVTPVETTVTSGDGTFKFTGLDPDEYWMVFTTKYDATGGPGGTPIGLVMVEANDPHNLGNDLIDSDAVVLNAAQPNIGQTANFLLGINQTRTDISAGVIGSVTVSVADTSVTEGQQGPNAMLFTVMLSRPSRFQISINYATAPGTATPLGLKRDFEATVGTLIFSPGVQTMVISVPILTDLTYEGLYEQLSLSLSGLVDGNPDPAAPKAILNDGFALGTIIGDDDAPRIYISDSVPDADVAAIPPAEADPLRFTIRLSNPSDQTITVRFQVVDGSSVEALDEVHYATLGAVAAPGVDVLAVLPAVQLVTFLPGQTEKVVSVLTNGDDVDEFDEHFFVDLFDAHQAIIADGRGVGIVQDDDSPVRVVLEPLPPDDPINNPHRITVSEGDVVSFRLRLLNPFSSAVKASGKEVVVTYSTNAGTAVSILPSSLFLQFLQSPDYINAGKNLPDGVAQMTFAPGETEKTFSVQTLDGDFYPEAPEEFFLNVLTAENADIAFNHAVIQVVDSDTPGSGTGYTSAVRFSQPFYTVVEGEKAQITLVRSFGSSTTYAVFFTQGITATEGVDYVGGTQIVQFGANEYVKVVTIQTNTDTQWEPNETVRLTMRSATGKPASAVPYVATLTIIDEIAPPVVEIISPVVTGTEGAGATLTFFVRSSVQTSNIRVFYKTQNITAVAGGGGDYISPGVGSFVDIPYGPDIDPVATIVIQLQNDLLVEAPETFAVILTGVEHAVLGQRDAIGVINDDDHESFTGRIFKDTNGNAFFEDFGGVPSATYVERGLAGVKVMVQDANSGNVFSTATTDSQGLFTASAPYGSVTIRVVESSLDDHFVGGFELTTENDVQTIEFRGGSGIEQFKPIGYQAKPLRFALAGKNEPVGRGGTDDTLIGGPGTDFIDAGGGDDHVVGGHWQTATNANAPINKDGSYDAPLRIFDPSTDLPNSKPLNGFIFEINTSNLGDNSTVSGSIWQDANGNGTFQGSEGLAHVLVHLFDFKGNEVDVVETGAQGGYSFKTYPGEYRVQVELPSGKFEHINSTDKIPTGWVDGVLQLNPNSGISLQAITIAANQTQSLDIELQAGPPPPASIGIDFQLPIYIVAQGAQDSFAIITVERSNATTRAAVIYRAFTGPGDDALSGIHYTPVMGVLHFEIGQLRRTFVVPILADGAIPDCGVVTLSLELRDVTGRALGTRKLEIQNLHSGEPDDDVIDAGDDWDIVLGDSGNIPGSLHSGRFQPTYPDVNSPMPLDPYTQIKFSGGPGADIIDGGGSLDYLFGQGDNDYMVGGPGLDYLDAALGDDFLVAELGDDILIGGGGFDKVLAQADANFHLEQNVPAIAKDRLTLTYPEFPSFVTRFTLIDIEQAQLVGGPSANVFTLTDWDGYAEIDGRAGIDRILVENDTNMTIADHLASSDAQLAYDAIKVALPNLNLQIGTTGDEAANDAPVTLFEVVNLSTNFPLGNVLNVFNNAAVHSPDLLGRFLYASRAHVTLQNGSIYNLDSVETATLVGGNSSNVINARDYTGGVTFQGKGGDDTFIGGPGNDIFRFDATDSGTDTITGDGSAVPSGTDIDTVDFSAIDTAVVVNLSTIMTDQLVKAGLKLRFQAENIEVLIGGAFDDNLIGNKLNNTLTGGPGNDRLEGKGGNETYSFDADLVWGVETVVEDPTDLTGHDTLDFSATTLFPVVLNLNITGVGPAAHQAIGNLTLVLEQGGIEEVIGGSQNDQITGNALDNTLRGGPGADLLLGGDGDDLLDGGSGNDRLDGGNGTDSIKETANVNFTLTDTRIFKGAEIDVLASIEFAQLTGGASTNIFTLTGWTGNAVLDGSTGGGDQFIFKAGADFKLGNLGANSIQLELDYPVTDAVADQKIDLHGIEIFLLTGDSTDDRIDGSALTNNAAGAPRGNFTFDGGAGDDTLIGTRWNDVLRGGPGADTITSGPGNDQVNGGEGVDTLSETRSLPAGVNFFLSSGFLIISSPAPNTPLELDLLTDFENASLTGGIGNDSLFVGSWIGGNVTLTGLGGLDTVSIQLDADITLANTGVTISGADTFSLALNTVENVVLTGGPGNNTIDASSYTGGLVTINGGGGDDILLAGGAGGIIRGGAGNDTITSGAGNDSIFGDDGDDRFIFNIDSQRGNDFLEDMSGIDTIDFSPSLVRGATLNLNFVLLQNVDALNLRLTLASPVQIENVIGGGGNDNFTGNDLSNTLEGRGGNDQLNGGLGNDTFLFDADTQLGSDTVTDSGGLDSLDFTPTQTVGITIDLGTLAVQTVNTNLRITLTSTSSIEIARGGDRADTLRGNLLNNTLIGGLGADTLIGGGGSDQTLETRDADFVLTNTSLTIGSETDTLNGIGTVLLSGGDGDNTLDASAFTGAVILLGGAGNDILRGGAGDDILVGGLGADTLDGRGGVNNRVLEIRDADFILNNVSLTSGGEVDTLVNIQGANLTGGAGHNTIDASAFTLGPVTLSGLDGNDVLTGGTQADTLVGGNGNDKLEGRGGNDVLRGEAGNDQYLFNQIAPLGTDTVIETAGMGIDALVGVDPFGVLNLVSLAAQVIGPNLTIVLQSLNVEGAIP